MGFFLSKWSPMEWSSMVCAPWKIHGICATNIPWISHGFLPLWNPIKWGSMVCIPWKIHGVWTNETPWNSRGYLPLWNPHGITFHGVVHHGKSLASVRSKFHRVPMGFCPYETPMDFPCYRYTMEFPCGFHRGKYLRELYGIYFIKNFMEDFRTGSLLSSIALYFCITQPLAIWTRGDSLNPRNPCS